MPARGVTERLDRTLVDALTRTASGGTPEAAVADLLGVVGRATGAAYAGFWSPVPGGSTERAAWPAGRRKRLPGDQVVTVPGGTADLGGPGWLVLTPPARGLDDAALALVRRAAGHVGLLAGAAQLDQELLRRTGRHRELVAELREAPARLRAARSAEQRRGVTEVLGAITPPLGEIRRRARDCAAALPADPAAARRAGQQLAGALEELIDRFRVVVRGVHSTVLEQQGLATALEEYAVDLPRPVRRTGDAVGRLRGEVASVLYHAGVPVLRTMAAAGSGPLELSVVAGDGRTAVRVAGPVPAPTRLTAVLAAETAALTAVGGRLTGAVDDAGRLRIEVSVPDLLRPPVRPAAPAGPGGGRADLLGRVRALCTSAVVAYAEGAGREELAALAARLDEPVRVAVAGPPGAVAAVGAELRRRDGVVLGGPEDVLVHVLAEGAVLAPAGPGGPYPLVVVDRTDPVDPDAGDPDPAGGAAPGGRRGVLAGVVEVRLDRRLVPVGGGGGGPAALAAGRADLLALLDVHVLGRSDALRCRSVLRAVRRVLHRQPLPADRSVPLLRELEELEAGAPELAELDALTVLRTGAAMLPDPVAAEAERLLGAAGPSPQARFGLAPGAGDAEVRVAATEHLARWSMRAEHRMGGRAGHEVCRAAVLACERVLAARP